MMIDNLILIIGASCLPSHVYCIALYSISAGGVSFFAGVPTKNDHSLGLLGAAGGLLIEKVRAVARQIETKGMGFPTRGAGHEPCGPAPGIKIAGQLDHPIILLESSCHNYPSFIRASTCFSIR